MDNNIDDFLSSLGFTESTPSNNTARRQVRSTPEPEPEPEEPKEQEEPQEETPEIHALSEEDFDDVLQAAGFVEASDEDEEYDEEDSQEEEFALNITTVGVSPITFREAENIIAQEEQEQEEEEEENTEDVDPDELVPENSPTLQISDAVSRFSGTEWFDIIQGASIVVAGLGGIGSNLVFQLARMNPRALFLYDGDIVEEANMSGQLYSREDTGKHKADAITDMIRNYTIERNIYAIRDNFDVGCQAGDIMLCGFDSMEARKMYFQVWKNHVLDMPIEKRAKCFFCDGRLSIDTLQVLSIKGDDAFNMQRYEREFLFDDAEADATVCSMKQTTYLACMIGSFMVNMFTNFMASTLNPIIPYDVPFFLEYSAQNVLLKAQM